jgi:hypothetical protein
MKPTLVQSEMMVVELKAKLAKTLQNPGPHNIHDAISLEKKVKLAVEVLAYSLYQDFPFDAAIALFLLANALHTRPERSSYHQAC